MDCTVQSQKGAVLVRGRSCFNLLEICYMWATRRWIMSGLLTWVGPWCPSCSRTIKSTAWMPEVCNMMAQNLQKPPNCNYVTYCWGPGEGSADGLRACHWVQNLFSTLIYCDKPFLLCKRWHAPARGLPQAGAGVVILHCLVMVYVVFQASEVLSGQ